MIGSSGPEPEEERPPWHWSAIGAVAIFIGWLPLAALASWLVAGMLERGGVVQGEAVPEAAMSRARLSMVAIHLLAFAIACFAGGLLVGRFGGKAGVKEATVAGFLAAAVAWALAAAQPGGASPGAPVWIAILVVIAAIGSAVARWGGRLGVSRRPRAGG